MNQKETMKTMAAAALALCAFGAQADATKTPANNSGINERDRSEQRLTPEDQPQAKADVELLAKIRRAVLDQPNLSLDGQNVKIITADNKVTLRGPVKDKAERKTIEKAVRGAAGGLTVDNQLEVR